MRLIVMTQDTIWPQETRMINMLFDLGMPTLHLRKPAASLDQTKHFIDQIDSSYYSRIVIHDHHELALEYDLAGVHLNSRCRVLSCLFDNYEGVVSRSCHSISELTQYSPVDYQFLSPIYNSISKDHYQAAFVDDELADAASKGLINKSVIALGGVTPSHISQLRSYHFGGVAVLGYLWGDRERQSVVSNFKILTNAIG